MYCGTYVVTILYNVPSSLIYLFYVGLLKEIIYSVVLYILIPFAFVGNVFYLFYKSVVNPFILIYSI